MAGPFDPGPVYTYPTWAQGLQQGTQGLANALYQRRLLDLERQKFGLQQAEAGYVPAHTEYQPRPGSLTAPSFVSTGNVPSPTPGVMQPGASTAISRGAPGQTVTDNLPGATPVKVPGHYDLTKSLGYLTSLNRIFEQQQRGAVAAGINAQSRNYVADENNATRRTIANNLNGFIGTDGQIHYGMRTLGAEALSGFNNGTFVPDPVTGKPVFQPGVATEGKIVAGQPAIDAKAADRAVRLQALNASINARQKSLDERTAHDRNTESAAALRAAQQAVVADQRAVKPPVFGFISPADSASFYGALAGNKARLAADQARVDSIRAAAPSGPAIAPHAPRSGADASGLRPGGPSGANVPTTPLGNRPVADSTTRTRPIAEHLPKSPSDHTVPVGAAAERANYNAAVARIVENVKDPAERDRQLAAAAKIYQSRTAPNQ